jgi:hypothetical protein
MCKCEDEPKKTFQQLKEFREKLKSARKVKQQNPKPKK